MAIITFNDSKKHASNSQFVDYGNPGSFLNNSTKIMPVVQPGESWGNDKDKSAIRKFFLTEGHIMITTVPLDIITVLGSCVSVCLWDKNRKIGGMNHFLLPGHALDETRNFSKGVSSTNSLIKSMLNRKCNKEDIEAKVFGGANTLHLNSVGRLNVEAAMNQLKEAGISIRASHTGGSFGRKIIFNTRTGKVMMRLINKSLSELNDDIERGLGV